MAKQEALFSLLQRQRAADEPDLFRLMVAQSAVSISTAGIFAAFNRLSEVGGGSEFCLHTELATLYVSSFSPRGAKIASEKLDCIGDLRGRVSGDWVHIREFLQHETLYTEPRLEIFLCDAGNSLWLGKSHAAVITKWSQNASTGTGSAPDPVEKALAEQIARLDALHSEGPEIPIDSFALRYERDDVLVGLLKRLRGPACQICGDTFVTSGGEFYCECHHLEALADGGLDVSSNMLILCPNHHRQFHHGNVAIKCRTADMIIFEIDEREHRCLVGGRRHPS